MTRKWERMVRRNSKTASKYRIKDGKMKIVNPNDPIVFKGRSLFFALFLIAISFFFLVANAGVQDGPMYYFVVISYFLFGLFIYYVRRPYLKISKTSLSTRKFTGEKTASFEDIASISLLKGYVVIEMKKKKTRWVFSKLINRFDTELMSVKLREFAKTNQVNLIDEISPKLEEMQTK